MGDIARVSLNNEELLYKLFGINAELLIDHAWGYESCTIKDIKNYKPKMNSFSNSQVLHVPYNYKDAKIVVLEMADALVLELVEKGLVTKRIDLVINYDTENINETYSGLIVNDRYGRRMPKESHGFYTFFKYTSSTKKILLEMSKIYDSIIKQNLTVRKITIVFNDIISYLDIDKKVIVKQLDLFSDNNELVKIDENLELDEEKEKNIQKVVIKIKNKYGKNAMLKGIDLEKKATAKDRNNQIGGHLA